MTLNLLNDVSEDLFLFTEHTLHNPQGNAVDPVNTVPHSSGVFSKKLLKQF